MFRLNVQMAAADSVPAERRDEVARAVAYAEQALRDCAEGLRFDAEQHRYFLGSRELRSVSSIVEWFAPFDAEGMAAKCSANPRHALYGRTVEEILAVWEAKRDTAAAAGTAVHEFAEACWLYATGRKGEIDAKYSPLLSPEGLGAPDAKCEAAARWWADLDRDRYVPVAKEMRIANPSLGYAGTLDALLYDLWGHGFVLRDYKTNEDIHKGSYGNNLRAPLNFLPADEINRYTVQQNLYKIPLDAIGLPVTDMSLVWLKEDASYEEIPIRDVSKIVGYAAGTVRPSPPARKERDTEAVFKLQIKPNQIPS